MSEVRVCENCNFHNNINNLECEKCGYDLSFIIPINEEEIVNNCEFTSVSGEINILSNWILESLDKQLVINIVNGLIIGRDGVNTEYFDKSKFVSRKHAIFYIENNNLFVVDASTNGTFINGKRLEKLKKTPIYISDKITFADLTFEVKNAN